MDYFANSAVAAARLHACRSFFQRLGAISLIVACFSLPLSVALMNVATLLMALCWFLSGKCLELPGILRRSPTATLAVALFCLLMASLAYTTAPFDYGLDILTKYRKLLYLPVVLSVAGDAFKVRRRAIDAFLWGCGALMFVSYCKWLTVLMGTAVFIDRHGFSVVHHITHGFFIAVFIFFLIERAISAKHQPSPPLALAVLAGFNLFYITPGRTGWGICLVLLAFVFIRRCSWRWLIVGLLTLAVLITIVWQSSSIVSVRCRDLVRETKYYRQGKSSTSMGMRYDWWHNATDLFTKAPWLGKGVGSFPGEQKKLVKSLHQRTKSTDNPHNEYLLLAEQVGVVGLLLFVALLVAPLVESRKHGLPPHDRRLSEGVVLAMAFGCLANSLLFDSQQGHFFILMTALLLTADANPAKAALSGGSQTLT